MEVNERELKAIMEALTGLREAGLLEEFLEPDTPGLAEHLIHRSWTKTFPTVSDVEISHKAAVHGDMNPIHHSAVAAQCIGADDVVASAMQLLGYVGSAISDEIPCVRARKVKEMDILQPLYPGMVPNVRCVITKKVRDMVVATGSLWGDEEQTYLVATGTFILTVHHGISLVA